MGSCALSRERTKLELFGRLEEVSAVEHLAREQIPASVEDAQSSAAVTVETDPIEEVHEETLGEVRPRRELDDAQVVGRPGELERDACRPGRHVSLHHVDGP